MLLNINHEGRFENDIINGFNIKLYVGGTVKHLGEYDIDKLSYFEVLGPVKDDLGCSIVSKLYFRAPCTSLSSGLRVINDVKDISEAIKASWKWGTIEFNTEHNVETEGEEGVNLGEGKEGGYEAGVEVEVNLGEGEA